MIKETTYYTKAGTGHPFKQVRRLKNNGIDVVSESCMMMPGDTVITELQYNQLVAQIEADHIVRLQAALTQQAADRQSAQVKLLGLGLTAAEVAAL